MVQRYMESMIKIRIVCGITKVMLKVLSDFFLFCKILHF